MQHCTTLQMCFVRDSPPRPHNSGIKARRLYVVALDELLDYGVDMTKIFTLWRLVLKIGWAKSGLWTSTTSKEKQTHIIALRLLNRNGDKALSLVIGPVLIVGAIVI